MRTFHSNPASHHVPIFPVICAAVPPWPRSLQSLLPCQRALSFSWPRHQPSSWPLPPLFCGVPPNRWKAKEVARNPQWKEFKFCIAGWQIRCRTITRGFLNTVCTLTGLLHLCKACTCGCLSYCNSVLSVLLLLRSNPLDFSSLWATALLMEKTTQRLRQQKKYLLLLKNISFYFHILHFWCIFSWYIRRQ